MIKPPQRGASYGCAKTGTIRQFARFLFRAHRRVLLESASSSKPRHRDPARAQRRPSTT